MLIRIILPFANAPQLNNINGVYSLLPRQWAHTNDFTLSLFTHLWLVL